MLKILFQPYPYISDVKSNIRFHLWIGLFVAFFLIVFQPFGSDLWITEYKFLKLFGYGLISFLVPTLFFFLRNVIFDKTDIETKYVVWHEIVWYLLILLSIALGNLIYAFFLGINSISFTSFFITVGIVISIGIFPVFASILIKHQNYLAINQKAAIGLEKNLHDIQTKETEENTQNQNTTKLNFIAENEKDNLTIEASDLVYIESQDNYSAFYFQKDGQLKKELLRGSLKRFESQISAPYITRCHRRYVVNLGKVEHIKGNAQGYQITLNNNFTIIPVSRNYTSQISQLLDK